MTARRHLLLVMLGLATTACFGHDEKNPVFYSNTSTGSLAAHVGDATFPLTDNVTTTVKGNDVDVVAIDRFGRRIELYVRDFASTGAVALGAGKKSYATFYAEPWLWSTELGQASGSINITSRTSAGIAGTFQGIMTPAPGSGGTGTVAVTEGTFSVKYSR